MVLSVVVVSICDSAIIMSHPFGNDVIVLGTFTIMVIVFCCPSGYIPIAQLIPPVDAIVHALSDTLWIITPELIVIVIVVLAASTLPLFQYTTEHVTVPLTYPTGLQSIVVYTFAIVSTRELTEA